MDKYREIVVPTDFSQLSAAAFPYARRMAEILGAQVKLLHVRTVYRDDPAQIHEELEHDSRSADQVPEWWPEAEQHAKPPTVVVRAISPPSGVLSYIEDHQPDLVIMGSHGRSGLVHFVLGSVAERVIRHSKVPVLTVFPKSLAKGADPSFSGLLVGFDFSEHSRRAVAQVLGLARRSGGQVHVLYAIQDTIHPAYYDLWGDSLTKPSFYDDWRATIAEAIPEITEEIRASLRDELASSSIQPVIAVVQGHPHEALLEYAEAHSIDLVAVGNHGLSGLDHLLLGSTTEKLLRSSSVPVLTFPSPRD